MNILERVIEEEMTEKDKKLYYWKAFEFKFVKSLESLLFPHGHDSPCINAIFSTSQYVYCIYNNFGTNILQLARFCKATATWQPLNLRFPARVHREVLFFCILVPWEKNTALVFALNVLYALELTTLTWTEINISQVLPDDRRVIVPLGDLHVYVQRAQMIVHWNCYALDRQNRCIYLQCSTYSKRTKLQNNIFCLHWDNKNWTKIEPIEDAEEEERVILAPNEKIGCFMALWEGKLIMGVRSQDIAMDENEQNPFRLFHAPPVFSYTKLVCIDLVTLKKERHHIIPFIVNESEIFFKGQCSVAWTQVGSKVYGIGTTEPDSHRYPERALDPYKTDLWSLDLPSLTWTQHLAPKVLVESSTSNMVTTVDDSTEIWIFPHKMQYTGTTFNVHKVSIDIPLLHSMAREAFFERRPLGLRHPGNVREFLEQNGYYAEVFILPKPEDI